MNSNLVVMSNSNELTNRQLKVKLGVMVTAERDGGNATWRFANALATIINDDLYKDDFDKRSEFAEAVGLSGGRISQCVGAVDFIEKHQQFDGISVENAYMLGTISVKEDGKKVNKTEDFIDYCDSHDIDITTLNTRNLKKLIKDFKDIAETVIDVEVTEETSEPTDTVEASNTPDTAENTDDKSAEIISVSVTEKGYSLKLADVKDEIVLDNRESVVTAIADFLDIIVNIVDIEGMVKDANK